MRNKILAFLFSLMICSVNSWAAWDATKPTDSEKLKDAPGDLRANFSAIATGTDSDLLITNAKVSSSAAIADTKLGTISTAGKVNASAITSLSSMPSGAGALPLVSGGTGQTTRADAINALLPTQSASKALISDGTNVSFGYPNSLTITSMAQGDILYVNSTPAVARLGAGTSGYVLQTNGSSANPSWVSKNSLLPTQTSNSGDYLTTDGTNASWVALNVHGTQTFTSSGTFTVPSPGEFTTIFIVGGGGGGGSGDVTSGGDNYAGGGGGSGGAGIIAGVYLPAGSYTVTVGTGGAGGSGGCGGSPSWSGCPGASGGNTTFGSLITATGGGGGAQGTGVNQGGGGTGGAAGAVTLSGVTGQFTSTTGTYTGTYIGSGGTINSWQQAGGSMCGDSCNQGGQGGGNPFGTGTTGTGGNTGNATGFGAGGGGSGYGSSYTAGNGSPGEVIVNW